MTGFLFLINPTNLNQKISFTFLIIGAFLILLIYKEPKKFNGGEFVIESTDTIECLNNRMIIIPGTAVHEVKTVELQEKDRDCRLGRYTITLFISPTANTQEAPQEKEWELK